MGRPPLNLKETKVRLSEDTRQRIEAIVGPNRMAAFIRMAIERELRQAERTARAERRHKELRPDDTRPSALDRLYPPDEDTG
jgi:predicted DNA-binding protein